jgi:thymidine kinase
VARLRFFHGPMGAGKSATAIDTVRGLTRQGYSVVTLTGYTRTRGSVTSRDGRSEPAYQLDSETDIAEVLCDVLSPSDRRKRLALVVDEAQFLSVEQVEDLAVLADLEQVEVACFGLLTDFRTRMFIGSRRLMELADVVAPIAGAAAVTCWCNGPAQVNARISPIGQVLYTGDQFLIADIGGEGITYEPLCRKHWRQGATRAVAARWAPVVGEGMLREFVLQRDARAARERDADAA